MSGTASKGFAITISAQDAASKQIDAINNRIKAMQAPAERLTKSFSKLAETTGITSLAHGMKDVADASYRAFENLGRMIAPLGVLTSAASIAGLSRLVTGFAESGAELYRASQRARIGAGDLAAYEGAAKLAGSSSEAMASGVKTLNDNMFHAAQGTAPDAIVAFDKLGIAWKDANGNLRNVKDVLPEVIQKLSEIKDPTYRAQIATMLLGSAAEDLAPVLQLSRKEFEAYVDAARQHGTLTDAQAKKALDLDLAQRQLTLATQGLGNAIAEQLAPIITPLLLDLTKWMDANRGIIASDLAGWINTVVPGIVHFGKEANVVAQYFGGWTTALETFGALILGGWALRIVAGLNPLVLALAGIALTMEKISTFEERSAPANLPAGSPFWDPNDVKTNSNYLNSPQGQEFWKANHPAEGFQVMHPNSWLPSLKQTLFPGVPRGVTDNNPLNLKGGAGGATALDDKGFGVYPDTQTGVSAAAKQLLRYQDRDHLNTIGGIVNKWAPPSENDTSGYIAGVSRDTGYGSDEKINLHDPAVMKRVIAAMAKRETRAVPEDQLTAGINMALPGAAPASNIAGGTGTAPAAAQTQTIKGSADLRVKIDTAPGLVAKTTASTSGDVFSGAPKIDAAMVY